MKRRRKISTPNLLFWNRRDQANFIANVERLGGICNDMERVLEPAKRKKKAAAVNGTAEPAELDADVALLEVLGLLQRYISKRPHHKAHLTTAMRQVEILLSGKAGDK